MTEKHAAKRLPNNVPGRFYTTEDCDGCAYCASVAPDNFDYEKSANQYYVCRQPEGQAEEELLREASDDCPLDAIRMDKLTVHMAIGESR
jgi:ferredoxin